MKTGRRTNGRPARQHFGSQNLLGRSRKRGCSRAAAEARQLRVCPLGTGSARIGLSQHTLGEFMTMTSWQKLLGLGAASVLVAAACTVSSGTDDDDGMVTTGTTGGSGGTSSSSGGSGGSGGSDSSGGSAGESGSTSTTSSNSTSTTSGGTGGSMPDLECLDTDSGEITGDPASCNLDESQDPNCCSKCIAANCCDAYANCFADNPYNICGGSTDENSEILTFQNCMLDVEGGAAPGIYDGSDFEFCIGETTDQISSGVCGLGTISGPMNELATCMHGDELGEGGCFAECLSADFDETTCTY